MKEGRSYAIWLLPCADVFETLMDTLAAQYRTPRFMPHATLCSGRWSGDAAKLSGIVEVLAGSASAVRLETAGFGQTDDYFRFFYLRLSAAGLDPLLGHVKTLLPSARLPSVGPHLSLLYSDVSETIDRAALAGELAAMIPPNVIFNRLALVYPNANGWKDVEGWQITQTVQLGGRGEV